MATPYFAGLAHIVKGDFTQVDGAGAVDLGETFDVTITPTLNNASAGEPGGAQLADGTYLNSTLFSIAIEYHKNEAPLMAALVDQFKLNETSGMDFVDETQKAVLESLCIVPVGEVAGAASSDKVWWFDRVVSDDISDLTFNDPEGEDAQNNYTISLMSRKSYEDASGTAIPKGARVGFMGDPSARNLTWALPAKYAA